MKIDLILAFVCSAVSAMSLAFLFVRGMLGTTDGLKRSGSSLRAGRIRRAWARTVAAPNQRSTETRLCPSTT